MNQAAPTVLLAMDSPAERAELQQWLAAVNPCQVTSLEADWESLGATVRAGSPGAQGLRLPSAPDIVLLDEPVYWAAGAWLQAYWQPHPPLFVVLLADADEALATRVLAAGAADYLVKSQLDGTRLRQTLAVLGQQVQLQRSLQRCYGQDVFAQAAVGINQADKSGRFIRVNQCFCDLLGYREAELLQLTYQDITHPDDLAAQANWEQQLFSQKNQTITVEKRYRAKAGHYIWTRVTLSTVKDEHNRPISDLAIVEDVSDRRQLETQLRDSEAELRGLFAAMDEVVLVLDRQGTYLKVAPAGYDKLYCPPSELLGQTVQDMLPAAQAEGILRCIQQVLTSQQPQELVYSLPIDGREQWFGARCSPLTAEQVIWVARDINDRKQLEQERQQAIAALAQNAAKFRNLIENASDITYTRRLDGTLTYLSPQVETILGYAPDKLVGTQRWAALMHPADATAAQHHVDHLIATGQPQREIELRVRHREGHWHWLRTNIGPIYDDQGTLVGIQGTCANIHDQKQVELALMQSEAQFEAIYQQAAVGICLASLASHQIISANQWFCDFLGYSEAELRQMRYIDYSHPDDMAADEELMERLLAHEITDFTLEKRFFHQSGELRWASLTVSLVSGVEGRPLYNIAIIQDITDRKAAELALQNSERKHRALIAALPDLIVRMSSDGYYLDFFAASNMTVLEGDGLVGCHMYERGLPRDLAERRMDYIRMARETGQLQIYEQTLFNGHKQAIEEVRILPSGDDEILIIVRDITDRQQAETSLRLSEQRLQTLINALPFGVWVRDADDRLVLQNQVDIERFGPLIGTVRSELPELPEVAEVYVACRQHAQLGEYFRYDRQETVAGETRHFQRIIGSFPDLDGREGMFGVYIDITKEKQAEIALQQNALKLKETQQIAKLGGWEINCQTGEGYLSEQVLAIYGFPPGSQIGRDCPAFPAAIDDYFNYFAPGARPQLKQALQKLVESGVPSDLELPFTTVQGQQLWVKVTGRPVYEDGVITRISGIFMDITDRKQAELVSQQALIALEHLNHNLDAQVRDRTAVLAARERELDSMFSSAAAGMAQIAPQSHQFLKVNQHFCDLLGYTPAALKPLDYLQLTHIDDRDRSQTHLQQLCRREIEEFYLEQRFVAPDGSLIWADTSMSAVWDAQGELSYYILVTVNITERKRAEIQLRDNEARLRATFAQAAVGIVQTNLQGQIIETNDKFCDIVGYSATELRLKSFGDITHPDDLAADQSRIAQLLTGGIDNFIIEKRYIHQSGRVVWANLAVSAIRDEAGANQYWIAVVQDISDRKRVEQQLQAERLRLQVALEAAHMGTWESNLEEEIWSEQTEAIFGFAPGTFLGDRAAFCDRLHPDDRDRVLTASRENFITGHPHSLEYRIYRLDGELRWVVVHAKALQLADSAEPKIIGVVLDVTERKQAEEALRDNEERLRLALNASNQGLYDLDLRTGEAIVSATYTTMLGYSPISFHETHVKWLQRLHPDDRDRVRAVYQAYVAGKIPEYKVEFRQRMKNGRWKWILSVGKIVAWDQQGNPTRLLGTHTDIDELKQAEELVRANEQRFRQLADNIKEVFWLTTPDHQILYISPAYEQVWGRPVAEVTSQSFFETMYPEDRQRLGLVPDEQGQITQPLDEGGEVEYRITRPDGTMRWIRDRAFPVRDEQGHVHRIAGVAEDITDRKRLEQEQSRLLSILEAAPDHIGMAKPDGTVLWNNRQAKILSGLPLDVDVTQIPVSAYHPEWVLETLQQVGIPTAMQEGIWVGETALLKPDGGEIPVSQLVLAHKSLDGKVEYLSTIIRDISTLKQAEQTLRKVNADLEIRVSERTAELSEARDAAESANRAKSKFLANMSHELRTPLNAILGFSQLLGRDRTLSPKHREELQIINRSGEHLLTLINDILEMSKIEAEQVVLTPSQFQLPQLLSSLLDMVRLKAEAKGLTLTMRGHPDLPHYIRTDGHKLRQVLLNLLSNAIKFTATGQVTLHVKPDRLTTPKPPQNRLPAVDGDLMLLHFAVEDSGAGIAPEELDLLFEPFVQTATGRDSQEGTGLGLPISRQFVQLMGGTLEVQSQPGKGSTFSFAMPVQVVAAAALDWSETPARPIAIAPDQPSYRLLIVEDNWANRILLQNLLTDLGFAVQVAVNGQAAVELWHTWQPHLIFMDIRMPVMTGCEATQAIRQQEQALADNQTAVQPTKIISLTADVFEEDQAEFADLGFDGLIYKPITEAGITQAIADHLGIQYLYETEEAPQLSSSARPPATPLTVEQLQTLPVNWMRRLHKAILQLNQEQMLALIAEIPDSQTDIAQALHHKIHNFEYEILLDLTQQMLDE